MGDRDFDEWFSTFRESISNYAYYTDFNKVISNTAAIQETLCLLNSLLGTRDTFSSRFINLATRRPEVLECIPILLAVRKKEIFVKTTDTEFCFNFAQRNLPLETYATFMKETGLEDLIANHRISSLVDYVFGVEVGLDSNGRKNRGGHLMEDLVEGYLRESNLSPLKEVYLRDLEHMCAINLSAISNNGDTEKRFDFVVCTENHIYAIETNFYASHGSKLNETARSYKTLALEAREIPNFSFVWFTDGCGWQSAKHNLKETFDVLPDLYNIHDLDQGIARTLFA